MLDVCCGLWGWSHGFALRGWKCIGIDLFQKPGPQGSRFVYMNIFSLTSQWIIENGIQFGCASTPCMEFAKWGMRMFHTSPPYPAYGIKMFRHVENCFLEAKIPFIMENVRAAQPFLGNAVNHCGPFYLWGTAVPPMMPQGIIKGMTREAVGYREFKGSDKWNRQHALIATGSKSKKRKELVALNSAIPPELAACVANYAERILEIKYAQEASAVHAEPVRTADATWCNKCGFQPCDCYAAKDS
jgi:hypothetical protein